MGKNMKDFVFSCGDWLIAARCDQSHIIKKKDYLIHIFEKLTKVPYFNPEKPV